MWAFPHPNREKNTIFTIIIIQYKNTIIIVNTGTLYLFPSVVSQISPWPKSDQNLKRKIFEKTQSKEKSVRILISIGFMGISFLFDEKNNKIELFANFNDNSYYYNKQFLILKRIMLQDPNNVGEIQDLQSKVVTKFVTKYIWVFLFIPIFGYHSLSRFALPKQAMRYSARIWMPMTMEAKLVEHILKFPLSKFFVFLPKIRLTDPLSRFLKGYLFKSS